jgi:prephenate dehydratase
MLSHGKQDSTQAHYQSSFIITVKDKVGALDECLSILREQSISLTRIESRPSKTQQWMYDFFVDFTASNEAQAQQALEALKPAVESLKLIHTTDNDELGMQSNYCLNNIF